MDIYEPHNFCQSGNEQSIVAREAGYLEPNGLKIGSPEIQFLANVEH